MKVWVICETKCYLDLILALHPVKILCRYSNSYANCTQVLGEVNSIMHGSLWLRFHTFQTNSVLQVRNLLIFKRKDDRSLGKPTCLKSFCTYTNDSEFVTSLLKRVDERETSEGHPCDVLTKDSSLNYRYYHFTRCFNKYCFAIVYNVLGILSAKTEIY